MELVAGGIAWAGGIFIYGTITEGKVGEKETFAMFMVVSMVVLFSIVNGVLV